METSQKLIFSIRYLLAAALVVLIFLFVNRACRKEEESPLISPVEPIIVSSPEEIPAIARNLERRVGLKRFSIPSRYSTINPCSGTTRKHPALARAALTRSTRPCPE